QVLTTAGGAATAVTALTPFAPAPPFHERIAVFELATATGVAPAVFAVKVKVPLELAAAVTWGLATVSVPKSVVAPPPVALGSAEVVWLMASTRFPMVFVSVAPIKTAFAVVPTGPVVKVYVTPPTDTVLPFMIVLPAPPPEVVRVPVAFWAVTALTPSTPFVPAPSLQVRFVEPVPVLDVAKSLEPLSVIAV